MLRFAVNLLLSLVVLGILSLALIAFVVIPDLPGINTLRDVRMQIPLRVFTHDGSLVAEFGEKRRIPVPIEDVPKQLIDAFIAAEDDRFYIHPGVDWQGILRAAINLAKTGEKTQGGSTITMQVARNFFLSREKSYIRKLNEIFLALKIERELSKEEILELYLNKIYLGQRAYGIGAAAQVYYGSTVQDLDLAQMAMIAGLPKAPSASNPISFPERALNRRSYVLNRMLDLGFITQQEFDSAIETSLSASLHSPNVEIEAPYIAEMVRQHLLEQYGEDAYTGGYNVYTTIRDRNQTVANYALRKALLEYDRRHGYRGPEQHISLEENNDIQYLQQVLETFPVIGNLIPAVVTEVGENSVTAYIAGIGSISIEWDGIRWARKYITENLRGPSPDKTDEILKAGDIIRVIEDESGQWKLSQLPAVEGGLVSLDPNNGSILALVGGFDFNRSKFNRVTQAKRQPGSSFKPFIYSTALEKGYTAASIVNDAPIVFDDPGIEEIWRPENYSGNYYGPTRLREALAHSRNLVSIRLLHAIGVPFALEHIKKFGFDINELPHNLSLALGSGAVTPWQLASSYSVFANGGYHIDPFFIERIEIGPDEIIFSAKPLVVCHACEQTAPTEVGETTQAEEAVTLSDPIDEQNISVDQSGNAGVNASERSATEQQYAPRVVDAENIWIMNSMTRDVIRLGTGRRALSLNRLDLSGKTGTTNDQRDAWFAGFNSSIVTITWVGFDKFDPLGNNETGSSAALPMWIDYMRVALNGTPESIPQRPPGLIMARIDPETGQLAGAGDPEAVFEVFRAKFAPRSFAPDDEKNILMELNKKNTEQLPEQLF